jgi:hypothetical protein
MELINSETTEAYPYFRLVSLGGIWEMGVTPESLYSEFFVALNPVGFDSYEVKYNCGNDKGILYSALIFVYLILSELDEQVDVAFVRKLFPYTTKSLGDDIDTWTSLRELPNLIKKLNLQKEEQLLDSYVIKLSAGFSLPCSYDIDNKRWINGDWLASYNYGSVFTTNIPNHAAKWSLTNAKTLIAKNIDKPEFKNATIWKREFDCWVEVLP